MPAEYGIIGYPLSHSFSPGYFAEKFAREGIDATYTAYPLQHISDLPSLLKIHPHLRGLNVTIPHKEAVIPYLDELDADAAAVGAVNCIDIRNDRRKGYNTDIIGFEKSLKPLLKPHHCDAFILGTGGAAKAVAHVLDKLGICYHFVSRTMSAKAMTYAMLAANELLRKHKLIINTTPLGMHPEVHQYPELPYHHMGHEHLCYDLIYNPAETKFLVRSKERCATVMNGLDMLRIQAEASWEIWNG